MTTTDFKWLQQQGYPILGFRVDGKPAQAFCEQKPQLLAQNILVLVPEPWTESLPPVEIGPDPAWGRPSEQSIQGAIRDRKAADEFRRMMQATEDGSFADQAQELPEGI